MDRSEQISILKQTLLRDVASLFQRTDVQWRVAIAEMIRDLRAASGPAVIFGGTLRSLLLGRLSSRPRFGRPRDLDIVVAGGNVDHLRDRLHAHLVRENRFGGLQLRREDWQFDVWPIEKTWAIARDHPLFSDFGSLPHTTFFNLEAVAVDLWARPGKGRTIYSGNDQFFEGLLDRTIEINRQENPFPALCIVRSLVLASSTNFHIGPRLALYLAERRNTVTASDLEAVQHQHYGSRRISGLEMRRWLDHVAAVHDQDPVTRVKLPARGQLCFWDDQEAPPRLFVHVASSRCSLVKCRAVPRSAANAAELQDTRYHTDR
jgi:hypothetical protein